MDAANVTRSEIVSVMRLHSRIHERTLCAEGVNMSINIQAKNDYSFLFGSLGSSSGSSASNLNFLSDYTAIKNGSYGKLMKAYYSPEPSKEISSLSQTKKASTTASTAADDTKTLAEVQSTTDSLKESADALLAKGKNSLFKDEDVNDKLYSAVSKFVDNYNSVLKTSDSVNSTSVLNRMQGLTSATSANKNLLEKVGITINKDNTLSIDKDTFMKADFNTVKNVFNGNGSYGYRVSAQASFINFAADNEATKANTYTNNGTYDIAYNSGNIFNSFF